MELKIDEKSKNYTCQVIKLPIKIAVPKLDNLVEVNFQGNSCLVGKESNEDNIYLFFPAESELSHEFVSNNNLYRHSELNADKTKKGFFEDNRRVKAVKFKGVISSGFIIPAESLANVLGDKIPDLQVGMEFTHIGDTEICKKHRRKSEREPGMSNPRTARINEIVEDKFVPEHMDTSHLLKNVHKLALNDYIAVSYKMHGTSARYFNALTKKALTWKDKVAKWFGVEVKEEEYNYISASRRVIKGVGFETLPDKNHFFTSGDLWSEVGKAEFEGKLNKGEAVYCEIIGKTYTGEAIQHGYTYGFERPKVYIYRISNINEQGIEIDLPYHQMKTRAIQLGIEVCPQFFYGTVHEFVSIFGGIDRSDVKEESLEQDLNNIFYGKLLERPSILDRTVVEEGFCIRLDQYPRPLIFKIKSKAFLLHEGHTLDKVDAVDLEEQEA